MKRWTWTLVAGLTLAVWLPTLRYDWALTWDDGLMFTANPYIRAWSWQWIWTTRYYGHWMPLTWISATLNYALFGLNPMAWHAVNVGLHMISAVLVYLIARRLVGSEFGAVVAALLWAVHPLRIESVAWITERKDVLMGVFFFGALLLWMQERRRWAFFAFVAACLSKSPAVILPVWLLAIEWYECGHVVTGWPEDWRWEHFRRRVMGLWPFVAVSGLISIWALRSLSMVPAELPWSLVPIHSRFLHAAYSELFYAMQTVNPARLSGLIEYTWIPSWNQTQYPLAVGVVLLFAAFLLRTWRRHAALTASAVCYTVAVLPQSGIFQNGPQLVANRYSYLACVPLALLAGGAVTAMARREARFDSAYPNVFVWPRLTVGLAVSVLVALVIRTEGALPMWKDGDAMWQYAATHEPTCTQCQDLASAADYRHGDVAAALRHQEQAIRVSSTTSNPRYERYWNRAALLVQLGRPDDARESLRLYLSTVPRQPGPSDEAHILRARMALKGLEGGS